MSRRSSSNRRVEQQAPSAVFRSSLRLQKFMASAGVDSRRNCESYICDGRVTVNSEIVANPAHIVQPETDVIELDGERLRLPKMRYFLLNKPKGVVCTNRDPSGRPRAIDLVSGNRDRLFTVGRLDEHTQGLLLLTNDGDLAEHMAHPRYEVVRRYRAQVVGVPTQETIAQLRRGMHFSEGYFRFREVRFLKRKGHSAFLEIELREGRNREVRRLLARCGHKVVQLDRVAFGPLRIGHLKPGQCRELRAAEVRELREFVARGPDERPVHRRSARRMPHRRDTGSTSAASAKSPAPRRRSRTKR